MYSLAIVDDEASIRKGLEVLVRWNDLGFRLAGCFENGEAVIDFLHTNHLDVLLCDIQMGNISGIDIAKFVYDNKLPTKIIFLTAHKDFDFAQKAIQYRVAEYLLKPTNIQDIQSKFTEIKKQLDQLAVLSHQQEELNKNMAQTMESIWNLIGYEEKILDQQIGSGKNQFYLHGNSQVFIFHLQITAQNSFPVSINDVRIVFENNDELLNQHIIPGEKDTYYLTTWCSLDFPNIEEHMQNRIDLINQSTNLVIRTIKTKSVRPSASPKKNMNLTYRHRDIFEMIDNYIHENIANKITLEFIAKQIFLNPSYLSRYFKQKKGMSFSIYLLDKRMAKAKELLLSGDIYIYEVCNQVGIENYKYFYKVFKQYTGVSPAEFREQKRIL